MQNKPFQLRVRTNRGMATLFVSHTDFKSDVARSAENTRAIELFVISYLALLSDSPLSQSRPKPLRTYMDFYRDLCNDPKGVVLRLAALSHELVSNHLLFGRVTSLGELVPQFRNTPVFPEFLEHLRLAETGVHLQDPSLIRYLYTFLNFGKKLEVVDEDFYRVAFRDWEDVETKLTNLKLDDIDTENLRLIVSELFLPRLWYTCLPKHGPGNVAERGVGRNPTSKHDAVRFDARIDRFLLHGLLGKDGLGREDSLSRNVVPNRHLWRDDGLRRPRPPARLLFVPKNMKTARSICEEPATLMFFQQGIWQEMAGAIHWSKLRKFIKLQDQGRNKDLARLGSISGLVDTLDLSAASDSVHVDLVRRIFPAYWLLKMLATRSSHVQVPDGSIRPLKKFAPMGSALCFPTQCIIFASVCIYASVLYRLGLQAGDRVLITRSQIHKAYKLTSNNEVNYYPPKAGRLNPLAIYGDDIVCDNRITDYVKSILTRLGFSVNENKSFTGSQAFRESCGGFYLEGHDISPLYFTVKEVRRTLTPNHVASHVELINRARGYGYRNLYRTLLRTLMGWEVSRRYETLGVPFRPFRLNEVWDSCLFRRMQFASSEKVQSWPTRVGVQSLDNRTSRVFSWDLKPREVLTDAVVGWGTRPQH